MGYGTAGHVGISRQTAFKMATNSWDYVPIISENLSTSIEQLVEENIYARYEEGPTHEGLLTAAGDIVMQPNPVMVGHFLRAVTGTTSSVAAGDAYNHQYLPAQSDFEASCALPPYTLQIFRDVGSAFQLTDMVCNALAFEISGGAIWRATASVMCRVSSLMNPSVPALPTGDPWTWDQTSVSIAGAAIGTLEDLTLTITNNVEGVTVLDTTKLHGLYKRNGARTFTLDGTMDFSDISEYQNFRSQTEQRFLVNLRGATEVASGYRDNLLFDLPLVRYTSYEGGISGPGRIQATFNGNAKYDTTSSYAFQATLTNTRGAY